MVASIIGKTFDRAARIAEKKGYVVNWSNVDEHDQPVKPYFIITNETGTRLVGTFYTQGELLEEVRRLR